MSSPPLDNKFKWTQLELTPDPAAGSPLPRSSHGLSYVEDDDNKPFLFLYGGEHVARTPLMEQDKQATPICGWLADLQQCAWHAVTVPNIDPKFLPAPRIAHAQAYDKASHSVYVFGGRAGITMQENAMNDLWVFQVGTRTWRPVETTGEPPEPRSFHRLVCVQNALYVFGGCGQTSGRLADLHRFDLETFEWSALPASTLLKGRGGPNLVPLANGTQLAVIAGFCGHETKDGHMFDIAQGEWKSELFLKPDDDKNLLRPRSVCASASFPEQGVTVIFGGEVDPSERGHEGAGGFANDLVVLDEKTGAVLQPSLQQLLPAPSPRGWADADGSDKEFFVFGGLAGDDALPVRLGDLWKLTFE